MLARAKRVFAAIAKHELLFALAVVVVVATVGTFLGHENNGVVPVNPAVSFQYAGQYPNGPHNPLDFMANWDALDYLSIGQHGYRVVGQTNFFPLYPLLIRAVSEVIPSVLLSAFLVAWAGFVGAVYFYIKIFKRLYRLADNYEALRGVLLFVLFPTGVFLFAPYTEGLFALLALGALYYALQKRAVPAAIFCLFATATHITGIFLLPLVGLLLLEEGERFRRAAIAVITGSLGLVAYMGFLQVRFHNALGFVAAQEGHGWLQHKDTSLVGEFGAINLVIIASLITAIIYWWPRRKSFSLYCLLFLSIPAIGGQLGGFNRYALMAFPVQLMFYERCRKYPLAYGVVMAATGVLWAHYVFQYAGGYIGG